MQIDILYSINLKFTSSGKNVYQGKLMIIDIGSLY